MRTRIYTGDFELDFRDDYRHLGISYHDYEFIVFIDEMLKKISSHFTAPSIRFIRCSILEGCRLQYASAIGKFAYWQYIFIGVEGIDMVMLDDDPVFYSWKYFVFLYHAQRLGIDNTLAHVTII